MATGSVSAALKDPSVADSFRIVRKANPDGFLLANIGAGSPVENAQRAVELFGADALQIHLNAPQELVMPEGDRQFSQWLSLLEKNDGFCCRSGCRKRGRLWDVPRNDPAVTGDRRTND